MPAALIWLKQSDLEDATSDSTVLACFDDDDTGQINASALYAVLNNAEQEVLSWLVTELGPAPISSAVMTQLAADSFLKYRAVQYAVYLMYDRAPEQVRQTSGDQDKRFATFRDGMTRILDARQRPPTVPTPPANVGGVSVSNSNRIFVDDPNGTSGGNAGDY